MPVAIDIYNNDIRNVDDNCIEADGVMLGFEGVPEVMRVYTNEMINFPPMNGDKRGRYQLAYTVATVTE